MVPKSASEDTTFGKTDLGILKRFKRSESHSRLLMLNKSVLDAFVTSVK